MATDFPTFEDVPDGTTPDPATPDVDAAFLNGLTTALNIVENQLPAKANIDDLATVATSGAYTDLVGVPFIPNSPDDIGAQPAGSYVTSSSLAPVATSGAYVDLTGKPTIPSTPAGVGLGNVNNTADVDKPVSTATQAAITALGSDIDGQLEYVNDRLDAQDGISNVGNLSATRTFTPGSGNGLAKLCTLTQNCTITFNPGNGDGTIKAMELVLTQDATGGRTVTWGSTIKWDNATPPVLSTAPGATDRILVTSYDNGVTWYGDVIGKGYA